MTDNQMLYCFIAFILGWLVSRQIRNGFLVELFDVGGRVTHHCDHALHREGLCRLPRISEGDAPENTGH